MSYTPTPTWDLATIYKQAFELTKKNRNLWILGLAVSLLAVSTSGNSSGSGSSGRTSSSPTSAIKNIEDNQAKSSFEEFGYRLSSNVGLSFAKVTPITYIAIGFELFAIAIMFGLIGIASSAWSRGSLIFGCAQADAQNHVDLAESGQAGRQSLKTILAIDYLPWLKVLLYGLIAGIVAIIFAVFKIEVAAALIGAIYFIFALYLAFKIIIAQIWAYRFAVISGQSYQLAMVNGKQLIPGNLGSMIILSIVNNLANSIISFLLLLPFGGAVIAVIFAAIINPNQTTIVGAVITTIVSALIALPLLKIKSAIFYAFAYLTWHLSFKQFNYSPVRT